MLYRSTRGDKNRISCAGAIAQGLAGDGGLFVPEEFPVLSPETISVLAAEPYCKRAAQIMSLFMADFSMEELERYTNAAYEVDGPGGFSDGKAAPLYDLSHSTHFLELWHGPTCAFKDMALQVMPGLLTASLKKIGETREVCILVATSGDTGKAALEGFSDVKGTKIMVFYPRDGVSEVQKLQMTSQSGDNVNVVAVEGNFDDAQTGVKKIFSDESLCTGLNKLGYMLSSANSINWGRLVPQVVYYISVYCDLLNSGSIKPGEKINFCVPTGNFGNILAAYYAERIGLPVNRLICASNRNDVLTQFIKTGVYSKNRPFYTTVSPSMDILVSSNLERLLFEMSGRNGSAVTSYMSALLTEGSYSVPDFVCSELDRIFHSGRCSEEDTMRTIKNVFDGHGYLIDTHTAVAYKVLNDYREETGDGSTSVVVSTASPFKFCEAVIKALEISDKRDEAMPPTGAALIDRLSESTNIAVPAPLNALKNAVPRFNETVAVSRMKDSVVDFIKR